MATGRRVMLFTHGGRQAIPIPRGFALPGKEAILRKDGGRLIVEPVRAPALLDVLARLAPLDESIPEPDDIAPDRPAGQQD
jgi:antitoxin VapB